MLFALSLITYFLLVLVAITVIANATKPAPMPMNKPAGFEPPESLLCKASGENKTCEF
jgi:hypothetical protein